MNYNQKKPDSYRTLLAFQKAECVYDITYYFIEHFMDRSHDRTVDQMEQAARSGKQNIVEGYSDAEGSTETEHKLTVIAKGSLEELKEDFRDYLRSHHQEIWGPRHEKYMVCQPLFKRHNDTVYYQRQIAGRSAEDIANIALIVIHQTLALIRGLIDWQDEKFLREGGIKEQRYRARTESRGYGYDSSGRWNSGRFGRSGRCSNEIPTEPTTPTEPTKPTTPTKPTEPTTPTKQ
ncbi:MAG: four helix bundle suffix domain-containing protein [Prevotella sp.]|nr:four helix bundle suffix domain-containing protein [Prevotella sp.]